MDQMDLYQSTVYTDNAQKVRWPQRHWCYSHCTRKRMKHGKNVKVIFLDFEKRKNVKKRKSNNSKYIRKCTPEDHSDHLQSVLLSFT